MQKINLDTMFQDAIERRNAEAKREGWTPSKEFSFRIRYYKRLKLFKASNLEFNPLTLEATSYNWWYFVKVIRGKVVFNKYIYSPTTTQHQYKVRNLLSQLGIQIDLEIEAPKGLQAPHSAIDFYSQQIADLQAAIDNPKSRKATNAVRQQRIMELKQQIKAVERLVGTDRDAYHDAVMSDRLAEVA